MYQEVILNSIKTNIFFYHFAFSCLRLKRIICKTQDSFVAVKIKITATSVKRIIFVSLK